MGEAGWSEESSLVYQALARVAVPRRTEQMATMLSLVPATPDDGFIAVELGCGEGFFSAALLEAYPSMHVIALDGSEEMRASAGARLDGFGPRAEVRDFDLHAPDWLPGLEGAGAVVSSLVIHHLDDAE
ncbi:MAG: class I SAM-dependent methyltransferase, partial [Actinomycetota bacterium]